jgi:hypothetical protein
MEEVFGSKETAADLEGVRAKVQHYEATKDGRAYEAEPVGN